MIAKPVVPGIYLISFGIVNTFLIDAGELTLIDAGVEGSERKILRAVEELGKRPSDLRHILITHLHADHTGGLAAIKKATGAKTYMHPLEAADYCKGITMRAIQPGKGLMGGLMTGIFSRGQNQRTAAAPIDQMLEDGQVLDFAGGLKVIHAPGHTKGQVVFLWPGQGGVLFLGDACSHLLRLGFSPIYEDREEGTQTLRMLAGLDFETACFSHGAPITPQASRQMEARFA
jgi:glyoxylase-like metal-dependent hydrolase (beta-lactamase superfamily II)